MIVNLSAALKTEIIRNTNGRTRFHVRIASHTLGDRQSTIPR